MIHIPRLSSPFGPASSRGRRTALSMLSLITAVGTIAGCSSASQHWIQPYNHDVFAVHPLPPGASYVAATDRPQAPADPPRGSIRPDDRTPEERVPQIFQRGRIVVGVASGLNLLGFQDPATGNLDGFEVELAREISRDIFGDPDRVVFRYVKPAERMADLQQGRVDIVVRTMTVTADRQKSIAFSTPYLQTSTRILANKNSNIMGTGDLNHKRVCVTKNSTTQLLAGEVAPRSPLLLATNWADCLMALQHSQTDAIMSDDAILAGIVAQDPFTSITGSSLASSEYAVGIAHPSSERDTTGLIQQVNSTIERIFADGTWQRLRAQWFDAYTDQHQSVLGVAPALNYDDDNPYPLDHEPVPAPKRETVAPRTPTASIPPRPTNR